MALIGVLGLCWGEFQTGQTLSGVLKSHPVSRPRSVKVGPQYVTGLISKVLVGQPRPYRGTEWNSVMNTEIGQ
jgi:hypothetical protein